MNETPTTILWDPAQSGRVPTAEEIDASRDQVPGQSLPGYVEPPGSPFWREAEAIRKRAERGEASAAELEDMNRLYDEATRLNGEWYRAKGHHPGSDRPVLGSHKLGAEPSRS